MNSESANRQAVEGMIDARPILSRVDSALNAIPGMKSDLILHAGPPLAWEDMSGPLRGAVMGALILEGLAKNEAQAAELAGSEATPI
jgi:hypothetical protein